MVSMILNKRYRIINFLAIGRLFILVQLLIFPLNHSLQAAPARDPLVVVEKAETETVIKQVPLTGTVTSAKVARLSTEVSGRVASVEVDVGDSVNKGDILLQLDSEIEQLTLDSALAATAQTRAELADARRRYKDGERLKKQNSISDNAIRLLQAEVEIDAAALRRQQAEQQRQQARVDRHTLKAPFSGVISERSAETGEWIQPGNAVMTLVAVDSLRIEFRVPQEFYPRIDEHSRVTVSLDAIPGRAFAGKIHAVVPVSDPSARTFLMQVTLDMADIKMTPGMSVRGLLHLHTREQAIVISRDALLRYPDGRITVWIVRPKGEQSTVSEQAVKIGHGFDGKIVILEGLNAGDVVVVEGNEALQDGQQIRIQDSD